MFEPSNAGRKKDALVRVLPVRNHLINLYLKGRWNAC